MYWYRLCFQRSRDISVETGSVGFDATTRAVVSHISPQAVSHCKVLNPMFLHQIMDDDLPEEALALQQIMSNVFQLKLTTKVLVEMSKLIKRQN